MKKIEDTWVRPFIKKYAKSLCLALLLSVLTFICAGALMFCSGYLISKSATHPDNILLVYVPIVLTRAFGIFRPSFQYAERLVSHNWVLKMTSKMRVMLYRLLEKEAVFLNNKYQTGELLDILAEDINEMQNLYLRTILPILSSIGLYAVIVIGLGCFSIPIALLILVLLSFIVLVVPYCALLRQAYFHERERKYTSQLYNKLTDNVLGINDWMIVGRQEEYLQSHEKIESQKDQARLNIQSRQRRYANYLQILLCIMIIVVFAWSTKYFQSSSLTTDYIAAFVLVIFPLIDVFAPLPDAYDGVNIYGSSVKRLNNLSHKDKQEQKKKESISLQGPYKLQIKNMKFAYPNGLAVFHKLNLTVNAGEKVAMLGRSGVGKSTLLSLLRGDLSPQEGNILLNGIETNKIENIHQYIGIIDQDGYLFSTTILNNLRLGNEQATEEEAWDVLHKVGLAERVSCLPNGLHETIKEAGFGFSGGEQQRLVLARILLSKTPIIILDEPTVGLDPATEQEIINLFFRELQDKTIIWITHHLQGIQQADRIIFLEDGELVMDDTYHNLLAENKHFQKLVTFEEI